jgi:single-stranded-DNA-specific exonuclease
LKVMARRARPGVAALLDVAQSRERPTAGTCGYALGPRINAAGRISEADLGLRLLLCDDPVEAAALAGTLDALNRQRQEVEASIMDAAMRIAEEQAGQGHAAMMISGAAWHPGVVGIVAGRIKERFNRPACVAGIADDLAKGSGRSVAGHDLGAVVIAARQMGILKTGGGHPMAAGFSLLPAQLPEFHAFLDERLAAAATLWKARWRCSAQPRSWRSIWGGWHRLARAMKNQCWCCNVPAWCVQIALARKAMRSAHSSRVRAAGHD